MPQGANRRHKRQDESRGKHRQGRGDWICRELGGASPERVKRLYGCGCPRSRKMQGVGWASRHYRAQPSGAATFLCGKGGKGSFRLSAALAPWSAAAFLSYMPTARLCHKAGQMFHHNALSRPVCRRTSRQKESRHAVAERVGSKHPEKTMWWVTFGGGCR